jgi:hypothetical protein
MTPGFNLKMADDSIGPTGKTNRNPLFVKNLVYFVFFGEMGI